MLTDRDRTLLAPHLNLLRAARSELAAAQATLTDAERRADQSRTGTDWRDRLLGGLLSIDEGRSQRFRGARRDRRTAQAMVDAAMKKYTKYATRMDELLEPILRRDDLAFRRILAAAKECDTAVRAAAGIRGNIDAALARPVSNTGKTKAERDTQAWHEAEFNRLRSTELIAEIRASARALEGLTERAARALGEVTGDPAPTSPTLSPVALSRLGATTGRSAERPLRDLHRQLGGVLTELERWRTRAEEARVAALRAAQDNLSG
ncbi:hypothetical protein [Paractinoplanes toevensis]|uniref:Uncharacterized protein n=1 Tax=Paractinoplanes toevensis TaxID=571911 RepID=A0A919W952_9ACTN|nr:hypothetical protein [Actinoplanes toevensis]GIM95768.1 hypothetical protein Ato02nite_075610 [Actinoplanes toevensis]